VRAPVSVWHFNKFFVLSLSGADCLVGGVLMSLSLFFVSPVCLSLVAVDQFPGLLVGD